MSLAFAVFRETSRLKSLLEPFSIIDDPREAGRMVHPLGEALFLAVCGSMAGCDHDEAVATWGEANLGSLRRCLPLRARRTQRTPADLLKNRIDPALFSAAFAA